MSRTLLSITSCLLLMSVPASAPANDIVDFLRAIQGYSNPRPVPPPPTLRRLDRQYDRDVRTAQRSIDRRYTERHRYTPPVAVPRSSSSFRISFGNPWQPVAQPVQAVPPVPVIPPQPIIPHAGPAVLAHQIGDIVTCPVALEQNVVVKDCDEIAPNACPVVVAVRDPRLDRYRRGHDCQERLVYVEIMVPPCPLQKLRVSPCKTKVRLDYGRYEVDIVSRNGCVEIDYDD